MSDAETPQEPGVQKETPSGPEEPSSPAEAGSGEVSPNRSLMIVLAYLWILFLIPLLVERDDREVQWHAKHGAVLTVLEIILQMIFNLVAATGIGCIFAIFIPLVFLGFAVIRLVCIVKGLNGERFLLPGVSQYADRF